MIALYRLPGNLLKIGALIANSTGTIWTILRKGHARMPYSKWIQICALVHEKKKLKGSSIFSFGALILQSTGTVWTILRKGHARTPQGKFDANLSIGLLVEVDWRKCWRTGGDHNSSTCALAQVR